MAVSQFYLYNEFLLALGNKTMSLNAADEIRMALFLSTSNCGDVALQTAQYATLTNQHANANGYTTTGAVTAATWTGNYSTATKTFDVADVTWTATPGSIVARYAVLYDNTSASKDLIAYCVLDATPADVTITVGNSLVMQIAATGVFRMVGS